MSTNPISLIIGVGFLLYGLYQLWKIIVIVRKQFASASWYLATGTVYDRNIKEHRRGRGGVSYEPEIMYRYTVNGVEYDRKISLETVIFTSAEKTLENVPETIEVHFNPERPGDHISSEERVRFEPVILTLITLLVGAYMLSIGLGLALGLPVIHFPVGTYHGGGK
ncbi:MAG TPA: DUF3592 domain-containing protein [Anaerolineaceae bacterium]